MMKPTVIRCNKCGYESNIISDICIKCGSTMEKVCGNCGFGNAVEKNYCDQCGKLLTFKIVEEKEEKKEVTSEKPSFGKDIEFESFHEAINRKDASYRKKISSQDELLKAKTEGILKEKEYFRKFAEEQKLKKEEEEIKLAATKNKTFWNKNRSYFIVFLIVVMIFLGFYLIIVPNLPKVTLLMTAKEYLTDLRNGNYKSAYELLSNNSKISCSFTEYLKQNENYYSKMSKWEFKNITVHKIDKTGAVIKYLLNENGKWKEDYISFVFEHGKWRRPYIWNLFGPIDDAIVKGDYPQALFLSQKLYLIDPFDPRTSGYLCNTEYLMGLYDKAIESCKRTLDSLSSYPVGFTQEEIFWYMFYYADSLRFQAQFDRAIELYNELFHFEELSIKNKCPLLMAKADAYVRRKIYEEAKDAMDEALNVCVSGINKEEALKRWKYISGKALDEAVSFAKRYKIGQEQLPLIRIVKSKIENIVKNSDGSILSAEDIWSASYRDGAIYEVIVKEVVKLKNKKKEEKNICELSLDLWTGEVRSGNCQLTMQK